MPMVKRLLLALIMVLALAGLASAQTIQPGDFEMDWAVLHSPVSSDMPTLEAGSGTIRLESAAGWCPPTSAWVVLGAPASSIMGGTTTWCIKASGEMDSSAGFISGRWLQYTDTHAIIEVEQGSRGNDKVMAVAVRKEGPPPPPPIKVFITNPKGGATVSGTVWVVIWAEGTSGAANVFTLSVDGTGVGTQNAGSSRGPITIPWNTKAGLNGTHTLQADVRDATGNSGTTIISVIVNNP
jgi:hypothetical protein